MITFYKLLKNLFQTDWFRKTWGETLVTRMLQNHFPYSVATANSRKRQRDSKQMLAALQVSEPSSSLLNLQLCLLVFLLTKPSHLWTQCIQYINRKYCRQIQSFLLFHTTKQTKNLYPCVYVELLENWLKCFLSNWLGKIKQKNICVKGSLRGGGPLKPEENSILCQCLEAASDQQTTPNMPSLLHVITRSGVLKNIDKPTNRKAFDYLAYIALLPSHQLHQ